jgi:lipopolysaccharide assembly outer membrane protein LptD (OstA)
MYKFINYANVILAVFTIFFCFMANAQVPGEDKTDAMLKKLRIDNLSFTGENINIENKISDTDKKKKSFRIQAELITIPEDKRSIILEGNARINFKDQVITGNRISINNLNPEFIHLFENAIEKNPLLKK